MRFFLPKLRIATLQLPQREFRTKLGGLPWGLPVEKWSKCQHCEEPMSLLAQVRHDPPAIDLGGDRVLHLFQCLRETCTSIWGCESGQGNDTVLIPFGELRTGLTAPPDDMMLAGEMWIDGWLEDDDGVNPSLADEFYDDERHSRLAEDVAVPHGFDPRFDTKAGGVPYWTGNGAHPRKSSQFELLFQLCQDVYFDSEVPSLEEVGCGHYSSELRDGRVIDSDSSQWWPPTKRNAPWGIFTERNSPGFYAQVSNFGSDGTAYVLINRKTDPPEVYWFWSR